jgi:hypothetical protein
MPVIASTIPAGGIACGVCIAAMPPGFALSLLRILSEYLKQLVFLCAVQAHDGVERIADAGTRAGCRGRGPRAARAATRLAADTNSRAKSTERRRLGIANAWGSRDAGKAD